MKTKIRIDIEGIDADIADFEKPLRDVAECYLEMHKPEPCDVNLAVYIEITDDERMRRINLEQREIDATTDVLSFPSTDSSKGTVIYDRFDIDYEHNELFLGDIIISKKRIFSQAEQYGHSPIRECLFLATHGLLHLLGYDHNEECDEKEMRNIQEKILEEAGYAR